MATEMGAVLGGWRRIDASESIDAFQFARCGEVLRAEVPIRALRRCAGTVLANDDCLRAELCGLVRDGKCYLGVQVYGQLRLACQRCLAEVEFELRIDQVCRLVRAELPQGARASDGDSWSVADIENEIVVDGRLSIIDLVEDEVLLELPMAPAHTWCSAFDANLGSPDRFSI